MQTGNRNRSNPLTKLLGSGVVGLWLLAAGCSQQPTAPATVLDVVDNGRNITDNATAPDYTGHIIFFINQTDRFLLNSCWQIKIDGNTQIVKKIDGVLTPIQFSDLAINDSVEVNGTLDPVDFAVLATYIRVRVEGETGDDAPPTVEFSASVTMINFATGELNLSDHSGVVSTNAKTVILAKPRNESRNSASGGPDLSPTMRVTLADLWVGDGVRVRAQQLANGTLVALAIAIESPLSERVEITELTSEIFFIQPQLKQILVQGCSCAVVEDGSLISNNTGGMISFDQLAVGDHVAMRGILDEFGIYHIARLTRTETL